jgi:hypothetical protein
MRALHKSRSNTRELRKSHINPAAEVRRIGADLSQIAIRFNEVALAVDSRRARRLSALSQFAEQAAVPLSRIARDLEAVRP